MPTGVITDEANADIETQSVAAEMQIRKCSKWIETQHTLLCISLIKSLFYFV